MKGSSVGQNKVESAGKFSAIEGSGALGVTTSSAEVAPANASRKAVLIYNDSDTVIYLGFGEDAVANQGARLNANGGLHREELFKGQINAIHGGSGTKNLTFIII